jgi:hypothetical protein
VTVAASGIWFEVWPAGWGFYHVKRCGAVVLGINWGPYTVATVFGRKRAIAKARSLEAPTFSTLADRGGGAAREAPQKGSSDG